MAKFNKDSCFAILTVIQDDAVVMEYGTWGDLNASINEGFTVYHCEIKGDEHEHEFNNLLLSAIKACNSNYICAKDGRITAMFKVEYLNALINIIDEHQHSNNDGKVYVETSENGENERVLSEIEAIIFKKMVVALF